ncbi:hypothetical protein KC319_g20493, partial [Hortaea werneckii]
VSRPPQPSRLRRLSELIDPLTLGERSHVRSPSGQILGAAEFMAHPGRPLSIRERQEAIREKVRATTAKLAEEAKKAEEEAAAAAAAKKRKLKGQFPAAGHQEYSPKSPYTCTGHNFYTV